jgi:hypothetical protein
MTTGRKPPPHDDTWVLIHHCWASVPGVIARSTCRAYSPSELKTGPTGRLRYIAAKGSLHTVLAAEPTAAICIWCVYIVREGRHQTLAYLGKSRTTRYHYG